MGLPIVYHPQYVAAIPEDHRFPMPKFALLYDKLLRDRIVRPDRVFQPEIAPTDWIELVHDRDYVHHYCNGTLDPKAQRRIGLPWSPEVTIRTRMAVGGAIETAKLALQYGLACNTAGGTHHAYPSYGSGFCIFNDIAITARYLQRHGLADRVLIVDLDVHQGDATAFIFQNDPKVFTFSMHCGANFPSQKQTSDLDVSLPIGMEDDDYLRELGRHLPDLLTQFRPDIVIFDAGVDPHVGDRLGKLALSDQGLYRREMQVLSACLSARIPVACVIGGGYCTDIHELVFRHSLLHRAGSELYRQYRL